MSCCLLSASKDTRERLLLIFTGWSTDEKIFTSLQLDGWDIMVIYDYTTPHGIDPTLLNRYREIAIMAWSFGVPVATRFIIDNPQLPLTSCIAVNGTLRPIDDQYGIPHDIFTATRNSLCDTSLQKFHRRMCGSSRAFKEWLQSAPTLRSIDTLRQELDIIAAIEDINKHTLLWDHVIISDNDLIIPSVNQQRAWASHPDVHTIAGAHLPDFQLIVNNLLSNKSLIKTRFQKAAPTYNDNADIQARIARSLTQKLTAHISPGSTDSVLEIGCGTGLFTRNYLQHIHPHHLHLWDISHIDPTLPGIHTICDAELRIINEKTEAHSLIVSTSTIQWFRSPIKFIRRCYSALRPGGLIVISTFGPDNFHELNPYIGSPLPPLHYLSLRAWQQSLPTDIEIIELTEEHHTLTFPTPTDLLRHIRLTGVTTSQTSDTHTALTIARSALTTLTYHPIYLLLRKP